MLDRQRLLERRVHVWVLRVGGLWRDVLQRAIDVLLHGTELLGRFEHVEDLQREQGAEQLLLHHRRRLRVGLLLQRHERFFVQDLPDDEGHLWVLLWNRYGLRHRLPLQRRHLHD